MHLPGDRAPERRLDAVVMKNLVTRQLTDALSVAVATLDGEHGESKSNRSERVYYFIAGQAKVKVGDDTYVVSPGDAVYVPKGTLHSVSGHARYVVVNAPAFDPTQEETQ
jgi:mannose-6-phosphate isomerase-like protein (cupin superfamily)